MTATTGNTAGNNGARPKATDVAVLRAEIAQTRADLGETVQALAAKADVKARLQESADDAKARVRVGLQHAATEARHAVRGNSKPLALAGAAAGALALIVLVVRWRRGR